MYPSNAERLGFGGVSNPGMPNPGLTNPGVSDPTDLLGSGLAAGFVIENRPFSFSLPRKVFQAQTWNPNNQRIEGSTENDDEAEAKEEPPCRIKKHQKKKKCDKEKKTEVIIYKIVEER